MKPKFFLLTLFFALLTFWANARNNTNPNEHTTGKKNDVNGSVLQSQSKKPLTKVSITAYLSSKKEKVIVTDECGNYFFDDLKPGTYKFVFEKDGFRRVTKDKVVVRTDEGFQMNIEMIQTEDFEFLPGTFHFANF